MAVNLSDKEMTSQNLRLIPLNINVFKKMRSKINVRYSEKAKKFEKIFQFDLVRKRQNLVNVFKECPLMVDLSVRFFQIKWPSQNI